ncbi:MAG: hypothetical protein JKY66_10670 [Spongiibacteraceae bacterium]|nr:hypothetical protein [Spongiibacteraceae bacterium]
MIVRLLSSYRRHPSQCLLALKRRLRHSVNVKNLVLLTGLVLPVASLEAAAYITAPNAPISQTQAAEIEKNVGCVSCHTDSDQKTMHRNPAVILSCTDCHGGDTVVLRPAGTEQGNARYDNAMNKAHILPKRPEDWPTPSSRNPERSYTLLNKESPEFIRFINPSDYRIVSEACGACHQETIETSVRSMHSTGAMLWGGAAYNNGILPFKNYILGSGYNRDGEAVKITGAKVPEALKQQMADKGVVEALYPMPAWETVKPGDIFRVFERGGRNIINLFPETGIPSNLGLIQRMEEPGRPDFRQSNRGEGTGARIAVPIINITKTRLNDPFTWFMGTNDQPGDYRNSGCASCHVVYANDRDPRHSGPYAKFGHDGKSATVDPTISNEESGHPITHEFSRAIPTSQCMICHMHQPNMFLNSFLGYTMWDYESDAPKMWPKKQQYPSSAQMHEVLERNPEGAAPRGLWGNLDFLKAVWENNDDKKDTQFADYHGHGWNFRAIFKRDRDGTLLDAQGNAVSDDDPDKFDKAVHMSSIHLDVGMHCVDCHFSQDNHGSGHLYGEVALAIEIDCKDCHGTAKSYPNLLTSGPAALEGGVDLTTMRTPDGRKRFEWVDGKLFQRSSMYPDKEWQLSLVKDTVNPLHREYNEKAARAKLMSKDTDKQRWGQDVPADQLAHSYDDMECYTCHTSWTTSCGGCHLPIEANWKTERLHYEGGESRNFSTYNPQVARDQMFLLGRRGPAKGGKIAPVRSSSGLILSSTNANREKIYIQQAPIASSGYSSQAFNPHFPHTVRKTETKTCSDCHVSKENDNNAIMAQLLMFGTNFINFVGYNAWVGGVGDITAVQVTEWDEPQAVIGSYLHKYAYPDWYQEHLDNSKVLQTAYSHSSKKSYCLQLRGEYLYVAEGSAGMQVYDVAGIANKGISQRIITAPFSPFGQKNRVDSQNATCIALPTNQPVNPALNEGDLMRITNMELPIHPIYSYAFVTDSQEGLILVDINTQSDGEPRNNFLWRALTWNEGGVLDGARHITIGGHYLYITADKGLVIVNVDDPMKPQLTAIVPLNGAVASALQFRYLFVTDEDGLKTIDVTNVETPVVVANNTIPIDQAYRIYLARTYAYVASGNEGLVIVDIEQPESMKVTQRFNGEGALVDSRDVIVATTNASLFAYVADGAGGLKVIQLTSPDSQPKFYGFSPEPKPEVIASYQTKSPALSLSKGLDRDRGVDETGGQIAVFGRKGSRPLNREEMNRLYLDKNNKPWFVED